MPDAIDSASSLGLFTLLHLCHNPQFQTKCQEQVREFRVWTRAGAPGVGPGWFRAGPGVGPVWVQDGWVREV